MLSAYSFLIVLTGIWDATLLRCSVLKIMGTPQPSITVVLAEFYRQYELS